MIGATGLEGAIINRSAEAEVTTDYDGYPAVRLRDRVWVNEPDQWIVAAGLDADLEDRVRDVAAALVTMADQMREERKAEAPA